VNALTLYRKLLTKGSKPLFVRGLTIYSLFANLK